MSAPAPLVVFITGCSNGGMGSALATEFARKGCLVYASARSLASMSQLGEDIHKLQVDVTDNLSCEQAVNTIYANVGHIDILVSCAGVGSIGPLLDMSLENTHKVMDTNLYGTIRLVHLIGPRMAKRGKGLIIPVGSTAGELSIPFMGAYNASKAALHAYTETLAEECRPLGVNVMLCAAGTVSTNISNNEVGNIERNLPENSLYRAYKPQMETILYMGQRDSPMPRVKFAESFVKKALNRSPPTYMTLGGGTTLWAFLKWLPRPMAIRIIWNAVVKKVE